MYFNHYFTVHGERVLIDLQSVCAVREADSMSSVVHLIDGKAWHVSVPISRLRADLAASGPDSSDELIIDGEG